MKTFFTSFVLVAALLCSPAAAGGGNSLRGRALLSSRHAGGARAPRALFSKAIKKANDSIAASIAQVQAAAAAAQAQALADASSADFSTEALASHNGIRAQCSSSMASLTWDADLAAYAQAYAEELAAAGTLSHSLNGHSSYGDVSAGENLYMTSSKYDTADFGAAVTRAVNSWAAEGYGSGAASSVTGHYTAINWSTTLKLGCGVAYDAAYGTVVSCNYADSPPNFGSDYDAYVPCTAPLSV